MLSHNAKWIADFASLNFCCKSFDAFVHVWNNVSGFSSFWNRRSKSFTFKKNSWNNDCNWGNTGDAIQARKLGSLTTYIQKFLILCGHVHGIFWIIECIFPRVQQEHQTKVTGSILLQRLLNCDEVFQWLGHLATGYCQVASVQKVIHPTCIIEISLKI